jgi:hypothetical protein
VKRVLEVLRRGFAGVRIAGVPRPTDRRQQAEDHAGEGRMDTGGVHAGPHHDAGQHVHARGADPDRLEHHDGGDAGADRDQPLGRDPRRVEDGDDQDRPDVVDHRERQQQHAQRWRHPPAQQRQDADREGDVGRHRHAPAAAAGAAGVERGIDDGRRQHAAHRGEQRQRRPAQVAELSLVHLAPDLEAHDEEEDRHQAVVDPEVQRPGERPGADRERGVGVPQGVIGAGPRRVGPDHRDRGGGDQRDAAGGLDRQEALDRAEQTARSDVSGRPRAGRQGSIGHRRLVAAGGPTRGSACSVVAAPLDLDST